MQSPMGLLVIPTGVSIVMAVIIFFLLLWLGYARAPGVFGFGSHIVKTAETVEYTSVDGETDQPQKRSITTETQSARTVWEWLTVLAISAVITVVTLLYANRQERQQRDLQFQQASDTAVQAYFDQMSILLIKDDLRTSSEDSEARTLARSRTLTILRQLDPAYRSQILQFLLEAGLVQRWEQMNPVINLSGANLSGVVIPADTNLTYADLSGADLSGANLSGTNLSTAYLMATDLHKANLSRATLSNSDLALADLSDANLNDVDLTMAKLNDTDLRDADLSDTELWQANLSDTDLRDADLTGAELWQANLRDAKGGVTENTLVEQDANFLESTMPDGHESGFHTADVGGWFEDTRGKIPAISPGSKIPAGEYDSDEFVPAFHVEVDKGWEATGDLESTDYIELAVGVKVDKNFRVVSNEGELIITNPSYVVNASNPGEQKEVRAPESIDEWVSWFQGHSNLDTTEPQPVNVGSVSGKRIDLTVTSTPKNSREVCDQPCVDLYNTNFSGVVAFKGRTERFLILDVGKETVVINVSIPAEKSEGISSKAEKLLNNLEWKGV